MGNKKNKNQKTVDIEAIINTKEERPPDGQCIAVFKLVYIPLGLITVSLIVLNFYLDFPASLVVLLGVTVVIQYLYWILLIKLLTTQFLRGVQ